MAKVSKIDREKKIERKVLRNLKKRKQLRAQSNDINLPDDERWAALQKLQSMPLNTSKVRLVRRCRSCGRPRAVYRRFGLCRICLRNAVVYGKVSGTSKSSWG